VRPPRAVRRQRTLFLGDELRALRELKRQSASPFVFASERGGPFIPLGFAKLFARAGDEPKIGFKGPPAHGIGIVPTLVVAAQQ
jgi:hypothetical protein